MPQYNYECSFCDHKFGKVEKSISRRETQYKCPECSTYNLVRLVGDGAMFELKGDGFYDGGIS